MKVVDIKTVNEVAYTMLGDPMLKMAVDAVMRSIPTIDLVQCKDCRMYEENREARTTFCRRELNYVYAKPDGFCSYGVRRGANATLD